MREKLAEWTSGEAMTGWNNCIPREKENKCTISV